MARYKGYQLVVTCEHATNKIPARYAQLFRGARALLASHRGWDPGALRVAKHLASAFDAPLFVGEVSRLLVDLNRSDWHPRLFSERVPESARREILERYYVPYREAVERAIRRHRRVVHLSIHSFTPVLDGESRNCDASFLYDPQRPREQDLAILLRDWLQQNVQGLRVRRNYPYVGYSDGFTTHLRKRLPVSRYLGLEWEMNQALSLGQGGARKLATVLEAALRAVLPT